MNKKTSTIGIIVLIVIFGLGWFFLMKQSTVSPIMNETATITIPKISINYSPLQKDIIYSETEGKYTNLDSERKELVKQALNISICLGVPSCTFDNPNSDLKWLLENTEFVSLYNDVLLLAIPSGKGSITYTAYNLKESTSTTVVTTFDFGIRSNSILVTNNGNGGLMYYKPGMSTVGKINIALQKNEYFNRLADWGGIEGSINNNILTVSIFVPKPQSADSMKVREVKFDLKNLK